VEGDVDSRDVAGVVVVVVVGTLVHPETGPAQPLNKKT
jgi:hypothetical protein